jgi:hypothetical protein
MFTCFVHIRGRDGVLCEVRVETIEIPDNRNIILEKDRLYTVSPLNRYLSIYELLIIIDCKNLLHRFGGIRVLSRARTINHIASVFVENIQQFNI